MIIIPETADFDRSEAFKDYAEHRAEGHVTLPPVLLSKHERRLHVRHTPARGPPVPHQQPPRGGRK